MKWLIALVVTILLGLVAIITLHEKPSRRSPGAASSGDKSVLISIGQTINLNDHLVEGTWTIIEFTADW